MKFILEIILELVLICPVAYGSQSQNSKAQMVDSEEGDNADLQEANTLLSNTELSAAERDSQKILDQEFIGEKSIEKNENSNIQENNLDKSLSSVEKISQEKKIKSEADYPVLTNYKKASGEGSSGLHRTLVGLTLLIVLIGGLVLISRLVIKKKFAKPLHSQIKVLTQFPLGPKKQLMIVRVAGESILIGVTDNQINLIKSLSLLDEDLPVDLPENFTLPQDLKMTSIHDENKSDGEMGLIHLKDKIVTRLKGMRAI
ncbi:MAG: flagellar biosynthetic protein FliO [Bdellovibrionales bacterium]|nr:flagellar biosynthetic protein FliO [Bdellovibrionales bacterium]